MSGIKKSYTAYSGVSNGVFDNNDCHVRAFALVLGITYEESHRLHKEAGRKDGAATWYGTSRKLIADHCLKEVKYDDCKYGITYKNGKFHYPTVKQFIWDHPKGKFLIHRDGHAFAIINGVVHDWSVGTGPRSRVIYAAKFGD